MTVLKLEQRGNHVVGLEITDDITADPQVHTVLYNITLAKARLILRQRKVVLV